MSHIICDIDFVDEVGSKDHMESLYQHFVVKL